MRAAWTAEEREIADEFLAHARAIRAEREAAAREARSRASSSCCNRWGGVTIAYRRRLIDSPSYTLNHEEVAKALEEGIRFAEGLTPVAVEVDALRPRARRLTQSRVAREGRRARDETSCCRRARSWSPPARSPTPCSRARTRATSSSTAGTSRRSTKQGSPVKPERDRQARRSRTC